MSDLLDDIHWMRSEERKIDRDIDFIVGEVRVELTKAITNWPKFNSAHEGFAVLSEEVDELWDHVKTNQKKRDIEAMKKECIQISAMAMRFAIEICNELDGRK
jgi:hypothetical protein